MDNKNVIVTHVTTDRDCSDYLFPDKKYIGIVKNFIKTENI